MTETPTDLTARRPDVEHWISPDAAAREDYSDYWNDESLELEKHTFYDVLEGDFGPMERHLEAEGLLADLDHCVQHLRRSGRELRGTGIDLAAGTAWAAPRLLASGNVERLYCLDYSQHRLLKLGPTVLAHYGVPADRVVLVLGSFYELRLPDASVDFMFLSQAFHHAERPDDLLAEMRRVLKPDGAVLIIGEHLVGWRSYARYFRNLAVARLIPARLQMRLFGRSATVSRATLRPRARDLFPADQDAGDHYYSRREYREMFRGHGFSHTRLHRRGAPFHSFVLRPSA